MTSPDAKNAADLIITGCTALVHDDHEQIDLVEDATIVVRDGLIESVTTDDPDDLEYTPAIERIDARGQLAMPGLVNCHTHAPMVALRGVAEDLPLEEWFNDVIWPIESNLKDKDVELGARLACAEMIRGGVTCFADHYFSMDTVAAVVADCGMRANLGEAYFSSQGAEGRERSLDFALRQRGAADGRITTSLAPHAPYTVDDADLAATAQLAGEHGLLVHIHAAENRDQTDTSLTRHGRTPIEILEGAGLLDVDLLIAHGTGIVERDLPVLAGCHGARRGGQCAARLPQVRLADDHSGTRPAGARHPCRARHGRGRVERFAGRVGCHGPHRADAEVHGA